MKKITYIITFLFLFSSAIFAENINFFTKASFFDAQFWQVDEPYDEDEVEARKFFANWVGGSIGAGLEFIVWDMQKKRGSRIFFRSEIGLDFMAPTYFGATTKGGDFSTDLNSNLTSQSMNGGALFSGMDMDIYFGGSFPRTDLLWGVGSKFYFMFLTAAPGVGTSAFKDYEKFAFFTAPSIFIGYDIFIPDTDFKITPILKTGITTNPFIPRPLVSDISDYESIYVTQDNGFKDLKNMYSGFFFEISVAMTFKSIQWKK